MFYGGQDFPEVPPGTVASDGIAQPSHMNFFLVSQQGWEMLVRCLGTFPCKSRAMAGIQGTSVPCHYHVLHMDKRLVARKVTVDDFDAKLQPICPRKKKQATTPIFRLGWRCPANEVPRRLVLESAVCASLFTFPLGRSRSRAKETITYQLCHMYSRADKSVGYATPAYMADHACNLARVV